MTWHQCFDMTAAKKIVEAEKILENLQKLSSGKEQQLEIIKFTKTIHAIFSHLLDEYNKKFGLKMERVGLEKFKTKAKKLGNIGAINFLIWYEKEYRRIKNDAVCGYLLERQDDGRFAMINNDGVVGSCSMLLDKTKAMVYHAYENF
jgi:uncharacterized damage-inducible protein DinB